MAKGDTPAPTQSATTKLGPEQQQLFDLALPGVRSFAASTPQRYQGSTVAGFDPSQTAGQEMALGAAGTQKTVADNAAAASNYWLNPGVLDVNNDPYVRSAIDASVRPITQNFTESVLPNIRSGSVASGGYGGSRQGIAEGLASGRTSQAVGDTAAKIAEEARQANIKAQLQALGLLPQTEQAQLAPALTTSGVGDVRQQQAQAGLTEQVGNANFDQYAPFLQSKEILSLLQGMPGATNIATGSVPPQPSGLTKALGGAATGASLGSMFGPWGTGIGAAGGAVLPFLF